MRVVHLTTYDGNGGAGKAALRLNKALKSLGVKSEVLTLYQFDKNSGVNVVYHSIFGKMLAILNILWERFFIKPYLKENGYSFSLQRRGFSIIKNRLIKEADIVHLHWINHGFISSKELFELGRLNKKTAWTLHDNNPITGGCHLRYGCEAFVNSCGNCPMLKNSSSTDLSNRTWNLKNNAYKNLDLSFIAPSLWMGEAAKRASLLNGKEVIIIPNALDTNLFKPLNKMACRSELGISLEKKIILAGSMPSKYNKNKGFDQLLEAIYFLPKIWPQLSALELIFLGEKKADFLQKLPMKVKFVGNIHDETKLVKYYNIADVFVLPSLEESLSYMTMESMACAVPVVAFKQGGVPDVIDHKINGFLAEYMSIKNLASGIQWVLENSQALSLPYEARNKIVKIFNDDLIAKKHLDFYKSILNKK